MKIRLEWFIVPCVATIFGGSALTLNAQDPPKLRRVVVNQVHGDVDAKSILDTVANGLENSGISEENKARILKNVEDALSKSTKAGDTVMKVAVRNVTGEAKEDDEKDRKEVELTIQKKMNVPYRGHAFTTQIYREPKNDGYRIGIQCSQVEDGDDKSEAQPGLEVKAVFDDSPAKKAGIEKGDILVSVNGSKISKIVDLTNAVQEAGKNEKEVTIELKRDEKVVSVTVKPTKMKSSDIELEDIHLALRSGGFVFDGDTRSLFRDLEMAGSGMPNGAQVLNLHSNSFDFKKDIDELKSELADLKKMIKELVDRK